MSTEANECVCEQGAGSPFQVLKPSFTAYVHEPPDGKTTWAAYVPAFGSVGLAVERAALACLGVLDDHGRPRIGRVGQRVATVLEDGELGRPGVARADARRRRREPDRRPAAGARRRGDGEDGDDDGSE